MFDTGVISDRDTDRVTDENIDRINEQDTGRTSDQETGRANEQNQPSLTSTNANEQDQAYRNMLQNIGVRINNNNHCTQAGASGCTTIAGAQEYTLNKIMQLKADDCPNCEVVVNAVTDKWIDNDGVAHTNTLHETRNQYSHDNGYKVDYQATGSLNRYFVGVSNPSQIAGIPDGQTAGVLTRAGSRTGEYGGPRFYDQEGNEYVYETNTGVWDVKYDRGASRA